MSKLTKDIRQNAIRYGSLPFWSWNDKLDPEELRRQIRNMKDMNMRGFFMHARGGLETEYLSEDWYECIEACVDEAKKHGMEAWSYDENGWPSGFAGGKLLEDPDNHAVFVECDTTESFPAATDATVGIYAMVDGMPRLTDAPVDGAKEYLHITMGTDSSYVDTMRADITEKFLAATHAEYEKRLGRDFGGAMPGFFTDEPQYYRWKTAYSRHMDKWFMENYGYSVKEALPALFIDYEGAELHRYDYHRMTHEKFTTGFSKTVYDWAEAHGIQITGHFIEENSLGWQMICCGDIMAQYRYEHIPGIDYLGRPLPTDVGSRQLGSVCAQLGRKKALSEMFACCGWDVTPRELKNVAEVQYAGGVNVMCQHLYPYSIRGQRKRDYPAFYSEHSPWQKDLATFNTYFNHLGYALSRGEEQTDVLVLHPIRTAWLTYQRVRHDEWIREHDGDFQRLNDTLLRASIPYHFGCESLMRDIASVEGNVLRVGACAYRTVVIPACDTLCDTTVALLREFMKNGGRVLTYLHHTPCRIDGRPADLSFLNGLPDLSEEGVLHELFESQSVCVDTPADAAVQDIRTMTRATELGRLIYVTNVSAKDFYGVTVRVKNCDGLSSVDILTLQNEPVFGKKVGDGVEITLDLPVGKSYLLTECEPLPMRDVAERRAPRFIALDAPLVARPIEKNYLTLDRAYVTVDGGERSELRPLERIRDELLLSRYAGKLTLTFPFHVTDVPGTLSVITEPMQTECLCINGHSLPFGEESALDRAFRVTDIAPYVKTGDNEISVTLSYYQREYVYEVLYGGASETLRNCLVFDTELEAMYLVGSFRLSTDREAFTVHGSPLSTDWQTVGAVGIRYRGGEMSLTAPQASVDVASITTDGYPYFTGTLTADGKLTWHEGDPTVLRVTGRYMTCHVAVDGREVGTLMFERTLDLAPYLTEGEHTVTLSATNSHRNLFGPHHHVIAEPTGISPRTFSFEKQWHDGVCELFCAEPSFVDFGLTVR